MYINLLTFYMNFYMITEHNFIKLELKKMLEFRWGPHLISKNDFKISLSSILS